mgnify:CR=1 FL=1
MSFRIVSCLLVPFLAALPLTGCKTLDKKKDEQIQKPEGNLTDQSRDVSFQSFVSRLRKAVQARDIVTLSSMMAPNFGYSWAPGGEGPGVFDYWDQHRLWPEVDRTLRQKFVPSGNFMVAPPEVASDPDYSGYRAGLRLVNGSWRFAYFVSAPPQEY